jgi:hypothetical protein
MPKVEMERPLSVPVVPARAAASDIIREITMEKGKWGDFALMVKLSTLGLPDVGYVAIPVLVDNVSEKLEPRHEIHFKLCARRNKDAFPTFDGGIGIDGNGPSMSLMWLAGTYEVPLQGLGTLLDQTLARGVAEQSLRNMLNELADAIQAKVEKRELADVRYRLIFNTGD